MIEPIERMRKLVNDNLVMGLRFQMNGELNKLESEIEQEFNSRAERTCHIVKNSLDAEHEPTNGTDGETNGIAADAPLVDEPPEGDSREKLEADVRQILHSAYMLAWIHGHEDRRGSSFEKLHVEFYNLLDRQAAITEEKTRYKWVTASAEEIAAWRSKAEKLQAQVYELTAERDNLAADLAACERDRESYREKLGAAVDHAHGILTLVDMDGEVVS